MAYIVAPWMLTNLRRMDLFYENRKPLKAFEQDLGIIRAPVTFSWVLLTLVFILV